MQNTFGGKFYNQMIHCLKISPDSSLIAWNISMRCICCESVYVDVTAAKRQDATCIDILEAMGVLDDKTKHATPVYGSNFQRVFQYGDVLRIQKLHQQNT
jgi:hypothetical protein